VYGKGIKFQEDLFDDIAGAGGKKKVVKKYYESKYYLFLSYTTYTNAYVS